MTFFKTDPSTGWTELSHPNVCSETFFVFFALAKLIAYGLKRKSKQVIDKDRNNYLLVCLGVVKIFVHHSLFTFYRGRSVWYLLIIYNFSGFLDYFKFHGIVCK